MFPFNEFIYIINIIGVKYSLNSNYARFCHRHYSGLTFVGNSHSNISKIHKHTECVYNLKYIFHKVYCIIFPQQMLELHFNDFHIIFSQSYANKCRETCF